MFETVSDVQLKILMQNQTTIFDSLIGIWNFRRKLINQKISLLSGEGIGTAGFTLIKENVLHYQEFGNFEFASGKTKIKQEYYFKRIYGNDKKEIIRKYRFEKGKEQFFYELNFINNEQDNVKSSESSQYISAAGNHVCKQDHYKANYNFFGQELLEGFLLTYEVKGPKKDYVSETMYSRKKD